MEGTPARVEQFHYDNKIVRAFAYASLLWGVVGMLVGLIIGGWALMLVSLFAGCLALVAQG